MILRLLRALRRLVSRRPHPSHAPSHSVAPCAIPEGYTYIHVEWKDGFAGPGTMCWYDPDTGAWAGGVACLAPGVAASIDPCYVASSPLDAIAARFDAAVDEAARGRNVPPSA